MTLGLVRMEAIGNQFELELWPQLRDAVDAMILKPPSLRPKSKISFEQMYSAVYKSVCGQLSDRLYPRLMDHVASILVSWKSHLDGLGRGDGQDVEMVKQLEAFTSQFFEALSSIIPIFTYMDRFYVTPKLHTDIQTEFNKMYGQKVTDSLIERVVRTVSATNNVPFRVSPNVVHSLLRHLHSINPNYSRLDEQLFSSHLMGIRAPMMETDLEAQREADRQLQERLIRSGFDSGNRSRKRCLADSSAD